MSYGICHLSIIPVRAQGSDKAELVTQLLFGEHYSINEETEKWAHITLEHDGYQGWICKKQLCEITHQEFDELSINDFPISAQNGVEVKAPWGTVSILKGAVLPYFAKGVFKLRKHTLKGSPKTADCTWEDLEEKCSEFVGAPYQWGGRSIFGIDCSGFTQIIARLCGVSLPRDAFQQAEEGEIVHLLDEAESGDLAFFDNQEGRITHVGFVFRTSEGFDIIHASGLVRRDKLDHQGIFRLDTKNYSHNLRTIRRIR